MTDQKFCYDTLEKNMNALYQLVDQVAQTASTALILGPSGSGKEAIAKRIHDKSTRRDQPLVTINCAAIPENLIESELFGHEKGAFTDANNLQTGKFEQAGAGTIFLDEISEMDLKNQAKILRVLEAREFYRVGGQTAIAMQARIIASSNKCLKTLSNKGLFREDLYYRINAMAVKVPSLKERARDIPLLADFLMHRLQIENDRELKLSPEVFHFLCQKSWPGNIRELRNFLTQLFFTSSDKVLTIHDLYEATDTSYEEKAPFIVSADKELSLQEIEKYFILHTMTQVHGNKSAAARVLKISLKTLRNKLKEYAYCPPTKIEKEQIRPSYFLS